MGVGPKINRIGCVVVAYLFADDTVLFSESEEEFQKIAYIAIC